MYLCIYNNILNMGPFCPDLTLDKLFEKVIQIF